jgi:hypothetical protein
MATKSEIIQESNNTYVPNTSGLITPQTVQTLNTDWINASIFPEQTGSMSVLNATSASFALTASFALNAAVNTGSLVTTSSFNAASSSLSTRVTNTEVTASNLVNASASFSTRVSDNTSNIQTLTSATASYAVLANNQTFSGKNTFNNDVTMSNVMVTGTASVAFLNVTFQSSSIIYASGSNQLGDAANDTQTLYGTVNVITGPLVVTGSSNFRSAFNCIRIKLSFNRWFGRSILNHRRNWQFIFF